MSRRGHLSTALDNRVRTAPPPLLGAGIQRPQLKRFSNGTQLLCDIATMLPSTVVWTVQAMFRCPRQQSHSFEQQLAGGDKDILSDGAEPVLDEPKEVSQPACHRGDFTNPTTATPKTSPPGKNSREFLPWKGLGVVRTQGDFHRVSTTTTPVRWQRLDVHHKD